MVLLFPPSRVLVFYASIDQLPCLCYDVIIIIFTPPLKFRDSNYGGAMLGCGYTATQPSLLHLTE